MGVSVNQLNSEHTLLYGSQNETPTRRRSARIDTDTQKFAVSIGTAGNNAELKSEDVVTLNTYHNMVAVLSSTAEVILDGDLVVSDVVNDDASTGLNDYLFCYNYANLGARFNTKAKMYFAKIWDEDNALARNFVPAQRISDSVVGMYDTVTGTFFTNAGSGGFIAGPEM